ncbi:MAG TPA: BMP family ABC transporter substrate-binding protein [Firmicutes bacterium]|nr:BMP family ABC transporter substrate-binding protein [Bacillota bacterium]
MKKLMSVFMLFVFAMTSLVACSSKDNAEGEASGSKIRVGMVTDSGSIDDKSFNQGTWTGINQYAEEFPADVKYVQPSGETTEDYLSSIDNLVTAGYEMIILPGYKFEEALTTAQTANPEVKFVILDGEPAEVNENSLSIFFTEHEAGFLAGVAAALQTKTGKLGFVGGMPIPPVERFGYGFLAGVAYANKTYGTTAEVIDYQYQGTFNDVAAGKTIAGGMYDKGIDIIFHAAASVGVGVINEAKTRAENDEEVYVIGVDVDQYEEGMTTKGNSVILTSAVKKIDVAAYENIKLFSEGNFPGGETLIMDAKQGGVGLPEENPNLTDDTVAKTDEVLEAIKSENIVVPSTKEALNEYLNTMEYNSSAINY